LLRDRITGPGRVRASYGALFDWQVGEPSLPARYRMIGEDRGGLWAAIDHAVDLGAIEFAHLHHPSGNGFGIWRPKAAG
jgi:hypothetical protein